MTERIEDAYDQIKDRLGLASYQAVKLADLREALGSRVSLAEFHEVIEALARREGGHVRAEPDQKTLTEADHRAAIVLGGTARHYLQLAKGDYRRTNGRKQKR